MLPKMPACSFLREKQVRAQRKRIWFRVKKAWSSGNDVLHPSSSTVVAEGLCLQDRKKKMKLLSFPPAFGMATDFTKVSREAVPSSPGRVGHGNGSDHGEPEEKKEGSQLPTGEGALASRGSGSESALAGVAQVRQVPAGLTKYFKKTQNSTHPKQLVFVLSILNCSQGEDVRWAVTGAACRSCVLVF